MKRVVVTGLGAVTPVGNNVADFWDSLINGKNGIDTITYFDVSESKYKMAAEVKNFDPLTFLDKSTVRKTDLFVQYALAAAQEAMEDSSLEGNIESDKLGVYFGSGIGGFNSLCDEHEVLLNRGARRVSPLFVSKMIYNIAAGNIAIKHKANGPNMAVSTACATGTTAIGEAYRAIAHGYANAIICGGSEAAITPLSVAGFGNCMALSSSTDKNAASIPFDKRRNGFVMGEGGAVLILEEYQHAINRNAKIYAEVVGYGSTCDAYHITAPDPDATFTTRAISDAIAGCGDVNEKNIYFNTHGTSTPLNDKTETKAIKNVFKEKAYDLHISSTKSMTGHMLGAAGAAEAIASILALRDGIVPPTINYCEPDEECDLNYTPNKAVKADLTLAISTSLGFGGHNAAIAFKKID